MSIGVPAKDDGNRPVQDGVVESSPGGGVTWWFKGEGRLGEMLIHRVDEFEGGEVGGEIVKDDSSRGGVGPVRCLGDVGIQRG